MQIDFMTSKITSSSYKKHSASERLKSKISFEKKKLEKELDKVKQSNDPKDVKAAETKDLQQKLKDLEKKESDIKGEVTKEKLENSSSTNSSKASNSDSSSTSSSNPAVSVDSDKNSMANTCDDVNKAEAEATEGLLSAAHHTKLSKVAYRVYKEAELKHDTSTMERALKLTGKELKSSAKSSKLLRKAIEVYAKTKQLQNKEAAEMVKHAHSKTKSNDKSNNIANTKNAANKSVEKNEQADESIKIINSLSSETASTDEKAIKVKIDGKA